MVVAIVGVLAALAIYGVPKYLLNSKTAEVRNAVGQMANERHRDRSRIESRRDSPQQGRARAFSVCASP